MSPEKSAAVINHNSEQVKRTVNAAKVIWLATFLQYKKSIKLLHLCFWPRRFGHVFRKAILASLQSNFRFIIILIVIVAVSWQSRMCSTHYITEKWDLWELLKHRTVMIHCTISSVIIWTMMAFSFCSLVLQDKWSRLKSSKERKECTGELNTKSPGRSWKSTEADDGRVLSLVKEKPFTWWRQVKNTLEKEDLVFQSIIKTHSWMQIEGLQQGADHW